MNEINFNHTLAVATLVAILAQIAGPAASAAAEQEIVQTISWSTEDGLPAGEAVFLYRQTPSCLAARLHVETPALDRVTLSYSFTPREGLMIYRLLDELSGWSLEQRQWTNLQFGTAATALDQERFLERVADVISAGQPPFSRLTLHGSGDIAFEQRFEGLDSYGPAAVLERMEREGFAFRLAQSAPAGAREMVRQLRSQVCDPNGVGRFCMFSEILTTLDAVLSRHTPSGSGISSPFSSGKGTVETSREPLDFEERELKFLRSFGSFNRRDPLNGTCGERGG